MNNITMNLSWEEAKKSLAIAAIDVREHLADLANVPYREYDGLGFCPVLMETYPDVIATATITCAMAKEWGFTPDQMLDEALAIAQQNRPMVLRNLSGVLTDMNVMGMEFPNVGLVLLGAKGEGTDPTAYRGAGALFYPGALDEAAKKMGGNFFILPSSIHEVLLIRDDDREGRWVELEEMVKVINAEEVEPADVLSNYVYHYDAATKTLEKASTYECRMLNQAG